MTLSSSSKTSNDRSYLSIKKSQGGETHKMSSSEIFIIFSEKALFFWYNLFLLDHPVQFSSWDGKTYPRLAPLSLFEFNYY